jgi:hypothetical protein
MSDTDEFQDCPPASADLAHQAAFLSLNYHFGMLLGEADFKTEQAYHRDKMRLHNMWLHREGVAWGFGVEVDIAKGEVRVHQGLAVDAIGREIHLEKAACLNFPAWLAGQKKDPPLFKVEAGVTTFSADVVIRFKSCLTRQVPALQEPCQNAGTTTAYSRQFETIQIDLVPIDKAHLPEPKPAPCHRLRIMFKLEKENLPQDQPILDRIAAVTDKVALFREFCALDTIDLRPPEGREFPITLARLTDIAVTDDSAGGTVTFDSKNLDLAIRPTLLATSVIQDLLARA